MADTDRVSEMTIEQWLEYGKQKGFCSEPVCTTHDMLPPTEEEAELEEKGEDWDFCVHAVRVYEQP